MSFLASSLLLLSASSVPALAPLDCPITKASYAMPGAEDWAVQFFKPKHAPTASSDLLMMVTGIDFVSDFAFASAQGFGGTSLLLADDDEDAGQPMPAAKQPEDSMAFHAFAISAEGGLMRIETAPMSTDKAPVAIYIPDVSKHFWYDEKYVDNETGETIDERVDMPQGLFIGSCPKS